MIGWAGQVVNRLVRFRPVMLICLKVETLIDESGVFDERYEFAYFDC